MKMGEIRWNNMRDKFMIKTPDGERPVTLRCRTDGVVCVEEVTDGHMSVRALEIQVQEHPPRSMTEHVQTISADQVRRVNGFPPRRDA